MITCYTSSFRVCLSYLANNFYVDPVFVTELFKIADYYGEEDLKRRCVQQLKVLATKENFGSVYSVATRYNTQVRWASVMRF